MIIYCFIHNFYLFICVFFTASTSDARQTSEAVGETNQNQPAQASDGNLGVNQKASESSSSQRKTKDKYAATKRRYKTLDPSLIVVDTRPSRPGFPARSALEIPPKPLDVAIVVGEDDDSSERDSEYCPSDDPRVLEDMNVDPEDEEEYHISLEAPAQVYATNEY